MYLFGDETPVSNGVFTPYPLRILYSVKKKKKKPAFSLGIKYNVILNVERNASRNPVPFTERAERWI